ncbi:MAG TPA: LEA type 2 family protein [Gemmatimonadaceae bacterium]|nr:LEA type 2 family protein [Gemmatimonadaceae bacterium]
MTRNVARAVCALAVVVSVSGCSFMRKQAFGQPDVTVADVRLAGLGTQGGTINVILAIYNPNNYRLDAEAINYRVLVDTLQLATGTIDRRVTLPQKDSTRISVPVTFGFREVLQIGTRLSQRGTLPFKMLGDVRIVTPFGGVTRTFSQSGTYDGVNISIVGK